ALLRAAGAGLAVPGAAPSPGRAAAAVLAAAAPAPQRGRRGRAAARGLLLPGRGRARRPRRGRVAPERRQPPAAEAPPDPAAADAVRGLARRDPCGRGGGAGRGLLRGGGP